MTEKNIYQRIHAVMEDVSYVLKEDKKVNNQYKFVSHDAVTGKIRPAFVKHGIIVLPDFYDVTQDGNKTICKVKMTFVNMDKPEDRIIVDCAGFGFGIDPQDKGAGKAMSYAYKYALLKMFALETGDDPEKDNIDHEPAVNPRIENLYFKLKDALDEFEDPDEFKGWWTVDSKVERDELKALCVKSHNNLVAAMKVKSEKIST